MANTTRFMIEIPDVGADADMWGTILNNYFNALEPKIFDRSAGDTVSGPLTVTGLTSVTTLNATGALTLSAGTANGVAYLNGSKVLTTGSGLTFDGTNFVLAGPSTTASGVIRAANSANTASIQMLTFGSAQAALGMWQANEGGLYSTSPINIMADSSGVIKFAAGGTTEQMRLTSTGLGIGTANPLARLDVSGASGFVAIVRSSTNAAVGQRWVRNGANVGEVGSADAIVIGGSASDFGLTTPSTNSLIFGTNNTERARITSGGYFKASNNGVYTAVDQTYHELRNTDNNAVVLSASTSTGASVRVYDSRLVSGSAGKHYDGYLNNVLVYTVLANGTVQNSTGLYQSISDRRVKDNLQPLTGSGDFIDALQPKTWEWNEASGKTGKSAGFIADEFQQIVPDAVTGQPDAVDEDGKPVYQAIDASTSEVMANIVAELQALRKRVAELEAK